MTIKRKADFEQFIDGFGEFRQSMNDWILFLNSQTREAKTQLRALERKVRELELEKDVRDRRF